MPGMHQEVSGTTLYQRPTLHGTEALLLYYRPKQPPISWVYAIALLVMNNNSSFDGGDFVEDLSKILNQLNQSEKEEIVFLYKDCLKSELILAF